MGVFERTLKRLVQERIVKEHTSLNDQEIGRLIDCKLKQLAKEVVNLLGKPNRDWLEGVAKSLSGSSANRKSGDWFSKLEVTNHREPEK